mmetsp:Transcript_25043/g.59154  ORF Transcript_25043/g.59154 Transcript_25043/m.59154 type:complete len:443 (-) Transcript_25043:161-1489(-)
MAATKRFKLKGPEREIFLPTQEEVTIGRAGADICFPSTRLSRTHAVLKFSSEGVLLVDKSTNGTCVNGFKVQECILTGGDCILFECARNVRVGDSYDVPTSKWRFYFEEVEADTSCADTSTKSPEITRTASAVPWACSICTFVNPKPLALVCEVCQSTRACDDPDASIVSSSGATEGETPAEGKSDFELAQELQKSFDAEITSAPSLSLHEIKARCAERAAADLALAQKLEAAERGDSGETENDAVLAAELQNEMDEERKREALARAEDILDVLADQRAHVYDWVKSHAKGLRVENVEENEFSRPGMPLYQRFVQAWERVADQTVQLAFHGTPEANIDAICEEGLDPKRRAGQAMGPGEYFATNAQTSLSFCRGGRKMLIFAVLKDRSGLTADSGGVVVIKKPAHQLPLFVLTFAVGPSKAHMPIPMPFSTPYARPRKRSRR